ncbi:phosphotransferase family protein [Clostridium cellulovorans]|uniref:Aminoglycoside phosphotransferase n=1 Tax=Clostridium cellulovorans (strain ATCC 35296 / DSM 3052 / OCM 3 / 743B) TaxID=573061 RepID=D9SQH4_CLOC7|nr:phosphotransferase [Clostridium cellulovorans]ADL50241.1 aminoglycoside phosphotransferase [Clostridium cellulovorans 743B]
MESLTKNKQTRETIKSMVEKAFDGVSILKVEELKEGFFNVAYSLELSDGREVILKIAPPKDSIIMTHEKNIMYSEVKSMKMIAENTDVPVANIIYYDDTHTLCESDYFFMNKLSGKSYSTIMNELTDEEKRKIDYQIGKLNAKINSITGNKFGYYGQPEKQGYKWFETFVTIMKDAIEDANSMDIELGVEAKFILDLLEKDKEYFDEVKIPKFIHWDLWAGNIFIENGAVTGLIDFERCLWADELMEVGFRTYGYNENFFSGYGIDELTESQKVRAKWYDMYLFLIVTLECDYRHYGDRGAYQWGTDMTREWVKDNYNHRTHD